MPRIGYLSGNMATTTAHPAFVRKLSSLGYVDQRNVEIISSGPSTEAAELRRMADELVGLRVDVIVAAGGSAQLAAGAATKTIPIVLVVGPDPEVIGLVKSIAQPGGNIT
ncbi:MAG TPA: ABC transporter substrate binding protein, partial [Candidatus Limnocylindria bacterium]